MVQVPLSVIMQHGPGLESALSFLSLGKFSSQVDYIPHPSTLEGLWSVPDLIPESDRVRVSDLIRQGSPTEAYRVLSLYEPNIRMLHQRYLEGNALADLRMSLEEAKARPWRERNVTVLMRRQFERFRDLVLSELQSEFPSRSLAEDLSRRMSALAGAEQSWENAASLVVDGAWLQSGKLPEGVAEGRIFFALSGKRVNDVWFYLVKSLEPSLKERGAHIEYKMHEFPGRMSRSDGLVLSFQARDHRWVYQEIVTMHRRFPDAFQSGAPAFAMPLVDPDGKIMPGVSFGQNPTTHEGFGKRRCQLLLRSLRVARLLRHEGQDIDWPEMCRIIVHLMVRAGIDRNHPAFEQGGREMFPFFSQFAVRSIGFESAEFECGLIDEELVTRYPCLSAADFASLRKVMGTEAFELWKQGTMVAEIPEEILDAVVQKLIRTLEQGRYGSRFQKLLEELRRGGEGPRIVRALKQKLKRDLPSLAKFSNGSGVDRLAWEVYQTWRSKTDRSVASFESTHKKKLTGLRDHLRSLPENSAPIQSLLHDLDRLLGK